MSTTTTIRMIDSEERPIEFDARQDGGPLGLIRPGRRTRLKIRPRAVACRVDRMILGPDPLHWNVCDIRVGGQCQFTSDAPEDDGIPGDMFSAEARGSFVSFSTLQVAMDLTLDVTYVGPDPDGAALACVLSCTVAREDGAMDAPPGTEFVGSWDDLRLGDGVATPVSNVALVALVASINWSDAVLAYAAARRVLEGEGEPPEDETKSLAQSLRGAEGYLSSFVEGEGDPARPGWNPDLASAARGLLLTALNARSALSSSRKIRRDPIGRR